MRLCEMESKRNIISVFPLTKAIWQIHSESRQEKENTEENCHEQQIHTKDFMDKAIRG